MRALVTVIALFLALCGTALAAFPKDPPNDPNYAAAERNCATKSVNDEQHYLYSKLSSCTPGAIDADGAAGMSVDAAWSSSPRGGPTRRSPTSRAGINWHRRGRQGPR